MFSFTPQAAQKLNEILTEKGGQLAFRIQIQRSLSGAKWQMTLERRAPSALVVNGVPVHVDPGALRQMDGLIIDWVMTPDGPGIGVYDRNLIDGDR